MRSATIVLVALFAAACGGVSDRSTVTNSINTKTDISSPSVSPAPESKTPSDEQANASDEHVEIADFKGTVGTTEKKNPDITGVAVLTDVRSARHGSYDRLVFEFSGKEMPSYHIEYIDRPVRACGSGYVVQLAGDAWLEVRFSDAQAHTPEGKPTIKDLSRSPNLPVVRELKITCDFEAEVAWVLGLSSPNRYRALELTNPTRLAIDISH